MPETSDSLSTRIKRLARATTVIPNLSTAGYYDFRSQTITVNVATADVLAAWERSSTPLYDAREYLATALHELTHWLDHTSTVWGQQYLVHLHDAHWAFERQDPGEFWRVMRLENAVQRGPASGNGFYQYVDQPDAHGSASTWQWQLSAGLEFDATGRLNEQRPIPFISFNDRASERIVRVPITTLALLEANATWAEYVVRDQVLRTLPAPAQAVEREEVSRRAKQALYDPQLALYSAAAHLVANTQDLTAAFDAYRLASALSTLTLNLTPTLIQRLRVPVDVEARFGDRVGRMLANADHGFAFLLLALAAPRAAEFPDVGAWVGATVAAAGLPSLPGVQGAAARQMAQLVAQLPPDGPTRQRATALLQVGARNFATRGVAPAEPLTLTVRDAECPYVLPSVVLDDGEAVRFGGLPIVDTSLGIEESVTWANRYFKWAYEFSAACRPTPLAV